MKTNIWLRILKKNINCKYFYLFLEKKIKMKNQAFIPSRGIGELYLDVGNMHWYMHNSSLFNFQKEILFFKLVLDMASLRMRYYLQLNGNRLFVLQMLLDIGCISTYLFKSFITIKSLTEIYFVLVILKRLIIAWKFTGNLWVMNHLIFLLEINRK